jgi:hypothetical protein
VKTAALCLNAKTSNKFLTIGLWLPKLVRFIGRIKVGLRKHKRRGIGYHVQDVIKMEFLACIMLNGAANVLFQVFLIDQLLLHAVTKSGTETSYSASCQRELLPAQKLYEESHAHFA